MSAVRVVAIGDGSGIVIDDRHVLTAAHVVKGLRRTIGELSEYREIIADDQSDVAILVREQPSDSPDLVPSLDSLLPCLGFPPERTNDVLPAQDRQADVRALDRRTRLDTRLDLLPFIENSACGALQSSPPYSMPTSYLPAGLAASPANRAQWSPSTTAAP